LTKKIIYFPHRPTTGGPSSFQARLESKLCKNGYAVSYADEEFKMKSSVIIVVNGTKKILWLIKCKIYGVKIIHRLDGVYTYSFNLKSGIKNFIKYRLILKLINFIRCWLADHIVYQSLYIKNSWEEFAGIKKKNTIIYNAVNLDEFYPIGKKTNILDLKVVAVEGSVQGELAVKALQSLAGYHVDVYGDLGKEIQDNIDNFQNEKIIFHGSIPRENISKVFIGRKIYLCLEINPACPNSVIESLASGVPVVGYNSGSLLELVGDAGIILPYNGGDPNKFEAPDCKDLNLAIKKINENYNYYSDQARLRAEKFFNLEKQFTKYKEIIEKNIF